MCENLGSLAVLRTNLQSSRAKGRVNTPLGTPLRGRASLRGGLPKRGDPVPSDAYPLPEDLARHAPKRAFAPEELRDACRSAGEGLGAEDARAT